MNTWHATLSYTLALDSDLEALAAALAADHGTARAEGRTLVIELPLRSVHIESLQSAARLAAYRARRALYAAGTVVASEDGLTVVLEPAVDLARAAGA
jgi:hypothetical protein